MVSNVYFAQGWFVTSFKGKDWVTIAVGRSQIHRGNYRSQRHIGTHHSWSWRVSCPKSNQKLPIEERQSNSSHGRIWLQSCHVLLPGVLGCVWLSERLVSQSLWRMSLVSWNSPKLDIWVWIPYYPYHHVLSLSLETISFSPGAWRIGKSGWQGPLVCCCWLLSAMMGALCKRRHFQRWERDFQ